MVEQEVRERVLENEARRLRLDYGDRAIEQRMIAKAAGDRQKPGAGDPELYAQAIALGLDDDLVIRRQLREKMRLFLQREPQPTAFGEAELAQALERHAETFRRPASYGFTQVFASEEAQAAKLRAEIEKSRLAPAEAANLGEPFPLAARSDGRSREQIAKSFGPAFAEAISGLELGQWSPPIASPFGWHLVYLHAKAAGGLPEVEEVKAQLVPLLAEEKAAARLEEQIAELRKLYRVEIEWLDQ